MKFIIWGSVPALLIILGITFWASGSNFSGFPSALVAWGTLMLAAATFTLIRHSKEQERRRREAELSKEKREREERLLNDIIEWATGCIRCAFELDRPYLTGASNAGAYVYRMQIDLLDKLKSFRTRVGYIKGIATPLLFGQSLSSAIEVAIECLKITITCIDQETFGTDEEKKEAKERLTEFIKRDGGLNTCMNKVLEEAAKFRIEVLKIDVSG